MIAIDSASIRILYAMNAIDLKNIETYDDLQRLEIGKDFSKYYSFFVFNSDSLVTAWKKKHPRAESVPVRSGVRGKHFNWSEYHYSEFFIDHSKNTFTEYARMPRYMNHLNSKYTEIIPIQEWEINEETKKILGFECQKATCHFRGRRYTAWFSMDVPINKGPWKFGGLPGLILKIYDDDELYKFECIQIETLKKKLPMMMYEDYKEYKPINRDKLLKLQKMLNEDYMKATGARNLKTQEPISNPVDYYPIEIQ